MRNAGISFQSYTNDLSPSHFPDNDPHHEEGGQHSEENDMNAQESLTQQRSISTKPAMSRQLKTNTPRAHALRFHRGTLVPEYGGKRYYDHGFIGIMGQESAARHALFEASVLKVPDLDLLRAHALLLTSMLNNSEAYPLWTLMGTTIRLAQSQGLHRDGTNLGVSLFEMEMRRRLWWYVVTLDARLTEIIGGETSLPKSMDASLPSNVNDDDLSPTMTYYSNIQIGASEMTFCLVRYEIARFQCERESSRSDHLSMPSRAIQPRVEGVERGSLSGLESLLEQKYLRFCDPVIPLQLLATTTARSTLCKLKQMAIHSISCVTPEEGHALPHTVDTEENRRMTFSLAVRNVQYDNLIHSTRSQGKYLWFVNFHIPWGGPVYVLKALAYRPDWDSDMEGAWAQIEELYDNHPEYLKHDKDIYHILRGLTLKAWSAREDVLKAKGLTVLSHVHTPVLVTAIKAKEYKRPEHSSGNDGGIPPHGGTIDHTSVTSGLDAISSVDIELLDPLFASGEWANWSAY
ncbi:hypothetical protein PISL3812_00722 [Talaromyces islandicus]|uniref:Xylanolytic transcriptional activator regulatory domain-containing protein n=1 Tax=Talaromyces islandicus TaxID=28573 RepID=A0A0U1LMM3_TALIS|nr:hypothetical protein PISL3812_00722 [Talaromyces islandicus]